MGRILINVGFSEHKQEDGSHSYGLTFGRSKPALHEFWDLGDGDHAATFRAHLDKIAASGTFFDFLGLMEATTGQAVIEGKDTQIDGRSFCQYVKAETGIKAPRLAFESLRGDK